MNPDAGGGTMPIAVLDMDIRNPEGGEWSDRVERLDRADSRR